MHIVTPVFNDLRDDERRFIEVLRRRQTVELWACGVLRWREDWSHDHNLYHWHKLGRDLNILRMSFERFREVIEWVEPPYRPRKIWRPAKSRRAFRQHGCQPKGPRRQRWKTDKYRPWRPNVGRYAKRIAARQHRRSSSTSQRSHYEARLKTWLYF